MTPPFRQPEEEYRRQAEPSSAPESGQPPDGREVIDPDDKDRGPLGTPPAESGGDDI
jgi:hypothetical protein